MNGDEYLNLQSYQSEVRKLNRVTNNMQQLRDKIAATDYTGIYNFKQRFDQQELEDYQTRIKRLEKRTQTARTAVMDAINVVDNSKQRQVLIMRFIDGLMIKEIASQLGYSVDYVSHISSSGMKQLEHSQGGR